MKITIDIDVKYKVINSPNGKYKDFEGQVFGRECRYGYGTWYEYGKILFEGQFMDLPHGRCIRYYSNGNIKYDGYYNYGEYHGKGILYDKNGNVIEQGRWDKGKLVKSFKTITIPKLIKPDISLLKQMNTPFKQ